MTSFPDTIVPLGLSDSLFAVLYAYEADPSKRKLNLGVGAYRDDNLLPWVLPTVKKAKERLQLREIIEEDVPFHGVASFISASAELMFGLHETSVLREHRVASVHTLAGSGAIHSGAMFLANPDVKTGTSSSHVLIPEPTWPPHLNIFSRTTPRSKIHFIDYYSVRAKSMNFETVLATLRDAPERSIVILHACGHNPTGRDPDKTQWQSIAAVMRQKFHFPFFDCAYSGLITGNPEADVWPIRYFAEELGMEVLVAQSFSKNLGLYCEHVGCLHYVAPKMSLQEGTVESLIKNAKLHLALQNQADFGSPPTYGARIASIILHDTELRKEWYQDLAVMAERLNGTRRQLKIKLDKLDTPGDWTHLIEECGMFVMTGLDETHVDWMREEKHIYMAMTGRISILGLNAENLDFFTQSLDEAVRRMRTEVGTLNHQNNGEVPNGRI